MIRIKNLPASIRKHVHKLGDELIDLIHVKSWYVPVFWIEQVSMNGEPQPVSIAVAVLRSGKCYVRTAKKYYLDNHINGRGFAVAAGRALTAAISLHDLAGNRHAFTIPSDLLADGKGKERYQYVGQQLQTLGYLQTQTPQ